MKRRVTAVSGSSPLNAPEQDHAAASATFAAARPAAGRSGRAGRGELGQRDIGPQLSAQAKSRRRRRMAERHREQLDMGRAASRHVIGERGIDVAKAGSPGRRR